jgi:hypothetical protein
MAPNLVEMVGLARTGGKQVILKCAGHHLIERVEFVSHNGRTSFPEMWLKTYERYHARAEHCKSF